MTGDDGVDAKHDDDASQPPEKAEGPLSPSNPKNGGNGKDGVDGEQSLAARFWTIVKEVFEVVSLVAVITTMIFVGLQWREMARQYGVMANQLKEMHTTGEDTHALAVATGRYAGDMKRLAEQATAQATQAKLLAGFAKTSADAARDSAAATNRQWLVMEQQAKLMQDQLTAARSASRDSAVAIERQLKISDTQAGSMKTLADATKDGAETSKASVASSNRNIAVLEQSMHVEQRAWIAVERIDLKETTPLFNRLFFRDQWNVMVIFHNVGRTPAVGVRVTAIIETVKAPDEPDFAASSKWYSTFGYAAPGQDFQMSPQLKNGEPFAPVSHKDILRISDGTTPGGIAYIYGRVVYDDIFGGAHWLEFCYSIEHRDWNACEQHNDDDSHRSVQTVTPPESTKPRDR